MQFQSALSAIAKKITHEKPTKKISPKNKTINNK